MNSRRLFGVVGGLVLVTALLTSGGTASAAVVPTEGAQRSAAAIQRAAAAPVVETKHFNRSFTRSGTWDLRPLKVCASYRLTGRIKGTREKYRHGSGFGNRWKAVRIVSPAYRVTTRRYYSHPTGFTCGDTLRVKKFKLRQTWKRSGCNPGLESISIGWFPSASFGCSKKQAAKRTSGYGAGSVVNQYNSTDVVRFKTFDCNGIQCAYTARVRAWVKITRRTPDGQDSDTASRDLSVQLPAAG